jgi:hypothetical protein
VHSVSRGRTHCRRGVSLGEHADEVAKADGGPRVEDEEAVPAVQRSVSKKVAIKQEASSK